MAIGNERPKEQHSPGRTVKTNTIIFASLRRTDLIRFSLIRFAAAAAAANCCLPYRAIVNHQTRFTGWRCVHKSFVCHSVWKAQKCWSKLAKIRRNTKRKRIAFEARLISGDRSGWVVARMRHALKKLRPSFNFFLRSVSARGQIRFSSCRVARQEFFVRIYNGNCLKYSAEDCRSSKYTLIMWEKKRRHAGGRSLISCFAVTSLGNLTNEITLTAELPPAASSATF